MAVIDTEDDASRWRPPPASADPLTGAWTRQHFEEALDNEVHRSRRYGHPVSLLLLDVDHFADIGETYGRTAGDQVLREVASCLRYAIRRSDSLTRWGGEEFVVLLPATSLSGANAAAERIRGKLAAHEFERIGQVTASLGVAEYIVSSSREEWLERAGAALDRARDDGRNRVAADPFRNEVQSIDQHLEGALLTLDWGKSYRCGNALIDACHEHLFRLANVLLDAFLSGRPVGEITDMVSSLSSAVARHFQDEEQVLARTGFAGLERHAELHADLVEKALALERAYGAGTMSLGDLFQFFAYDLVASHMLKEDQQFCHLMTAPQG